MQSNSADPAADPKVRTQQSTCSLLFHLVVKGSAGKSYAQDTGGGLRQKWTKALAISCAKESCRLGVGKPSAILVQSHKGAQGHSKQSPAGQTFFEILPASF